VYTFFEKQIDFFCNAEREKMLEYKKNNIGIVRVYNIIPITHKQYCDGYERGISE